MDLRTGYLKPIAPFNFSIMLDHVHQHSPTSDDQTVNSRQLIKAFHIQGKTYGIRLNDEGTPEQPRLQCTVIAREKMEDIEVENAIRALRFYLDMDADLNKFYKLAEQDSLFKPLVRNFYGMHLVRFSSLFEAAVWTLLNQERQVDRARQLKKQFHLRLGSNINLNGINYRAFPSPTQWLRAVPNDRELAMPDSRLRPKLQLIAEKLQEADKYKLRDTPFDQLMQWLRNGTGLSEPSAGRIIVYGIGRNDKLCFHDTELSRAATKVYGNHYTINLPTIKRLAEPYGNWKAYWAHYLRLSSR